MKKTNQKSSSGITLIALVVTIIVLLILAGISISMITGDNSLIQKTIDAKTKTGEAEIREKIQLAEISAMVNKNAKIDYDALKSALAKEFGTKGIDWDISDEEENPWVVTVGEVIYNIAHKDSDEDNSTGIIVDHNGTKVDISKVPATEIANYYGDYVLNYTTGGTYQLYYVDSEGDFGESGRIYIQNIEYYAPLSDYSSYSGIRLDNHFETTGIKDTTSLIYKLNPDWSREVGNSLTTLDNDDIPSKLKAVAFLCNTSNWNPTYVTSEDQQKGVWAIGGVSVEMFCSSYNAKLHPTTEISAQAFSYENSYPVGYGYKPGNGSVKNSDYAEYSRDSLRVSRKQYVFFRYFR